MSIGVNAAHSWSFSLFGPVIDSAALTDMAVEHATRLTLAPYFNGFLAGIDKSGKPVEIAPLINQIKDIRARTDVLRGYL